MFLICGEALFDVFTQSPQGDAIPMLARPGGSPFNVAIGLSRLGSPSALLGGLSRDMLGQHLAGILRREGVCADYLIARDERTTLSLVALDAQGVPHYTFYGEHSADRALEVADLPALSADVHGLHVGSYTLVAEPTASTLLRLVTQARGERLISLDPNIRPTVEPDMARWRSRVGAVAAQADLIKVSEEDLGLLYPGEPVEAAARRWLDGGTQLVVVTLGAEGALGFSRQAQTQVAGRPVVVADTVGAGDSFQAALLHQLPDRAALEAAAAEAQAMQRLLIFAATAAGITCSRPGADPPTHAQVLDALG